MVASAFLVVVRCTALLFITDNAARCPPVVNMFAGGVPGCASVRAVAVALLVLPAVRGRGRAAALLPDLHQFVSPGVRGQQAGRLS